MSETFHFTETSSLRSGEQAPDREYPDEQKKQPITLIDPFVAMRISPSRQRPVVRRHDAALDAVAMRLAFADSSTEIFPIEFVWNPHLRGKRCLATALQDAAAITMGHPPYHVGNLSLY
jgi:hypothetical protein